MFRNISGAFLLLCATITLSACASGSRSEKMIVAMDNTIAAPTSHKLYNNISLANIAGGKETNPLLMSKVDNTAFGEALKQSLANNSYLSDGDNGRYILNAELLALEQPIMGFSFTVDSVVEYELTDTRNNSVMFKATVKSKGTATMGDSLVGMERLRISNEFSVKNNIKEMWEKLVQQDTPRS